MAQVEMSNVILFSFIWRVLDGLDIASDPRYILNFKQYYDPLAVIDRSEVYHEV